MENYMAGKLELTINCLIVMLFIFIVVMLIHGNLLIASPSENTCYTVGGFICTKYDTPDSWYNPSYGFKFEDDIPENILLWQTHDGGKFYELRQLMGVYI